MVLFKKKRKLKTYKIVCARSRAHYESFKYISYFKEQQSQPQQQNEMRINYVIASFKGRNNMCVYSFS